MDENYQSKLYLSWTLKSMLELLLNCHVILAFGTL